jgi:glutaredoxin
LNPFRHILTTNDTKGDAVYQREMVLYTRGPSLSRWRARRFLSRAGYRFEVVDVAGDPGMLEKLSEASRRKVPPSPYVFVDRRPVGGMVTVRALAGSGGLEHLLRDDL